MKNLAWIAAVSLAGLPWGAHAVTFDCTKARSAPEKLICSTPDLSRADDHLKQSFEAARARATDKKAFNDRAKQEWQRREKTCTDAACVRQWYADQERLYAATDATPAVPAQPAPKPATAQSPASAQSSSSAPASAHPAAPQSTPDTRPAAAPQAAAPAPNAAAAGAHGAPAQATPVPAANAPEVAATVLYADYQQSESAADRKYKGKTIKISGTVAGVTAPANGDPYIELTAADSAMPKVHLDFPQTASARIAAIKKGQKISLQCVGQGLVIGDPVLRCADAP